MSDAPIVTEDMFTGWGTPSAQAQSSRPRLALLVLCTAMFMASLDMFIVNVALGHIAADYRVTSLSSLSWILNGYTILYGAVLVPAGRLADRFGRRAAFQMGLAVFTGASVACAASTSLPMLVTFRCFQAIGAGIVTPASLGLVLTVLPVENRQRAVKLWASSGALAGAFGPVVGGLLLAFSWRWIFLINQPIGIGAFAMARSVIPPTSARSGTPLPDLVGGAAIVVAVGALALGVVQGPDWGWHSGRAIACWIAVLVAAAVVVARATRHPSPILEATLFVHRTFRFANMAVFVAAAVFAINILGGILFLERVWGYSALRTGLAIAPGPLIVPIFALLSTKLAGRIGPGMVVALGCLMLGTGSLLFALFVGPSTAPAYVAYFLPGWMIGSAGVGFAFPTGIAAATSELPADRASTGSAVVNMARQLGTVIGTSILVVVLTMKHGHFSPAWYFSGALAVLAALIAPGITPRR